jgi:hypothetical protein
MAFSSGFGSVSVAISKASATTIVDDTKPATPPSSTATAEADSTAQVGVSKPWYWGWRPLS